MPGFHQHLPLSGTAELGPRDVSKTKCHRGQRHVPAAVVHARSIQFPLFWCLIFPSVASGPYRALAFHLLTSRTNHTKLFVKAKLNDLTNHPDLVSRDWNSAINEARKFHLCCDGGGGGFGATLNRNNPMALPAPLLTSVTLLPRMDGADPSLPPRLACSSRPLDTSVSISSKPYSSPPPTIRLSNRFTKSM